MSDAQSIPKTKAKRPREKAGGWAGIARRFSGRGRIRSVFLLAAIVFCSWSSEFAAAGAVVFTLGVMLHAIAKGHLVRNTQLCQDGPYGWVRNPFYVANFLIDSGLCLLSGLPYLALMYCVMFPLAYLPRIFAEEEMLREHFGTAFDAYCKQTPRLFPRSIPRLIKWLLSTSYENLRRENELSRLVRLCGYPFFITAVILAKTTWNNPQMHIESLAACAVAVSLSMWGAGEIIHAQVEDGKPLTMRIVMRFLPLAWLFLPLLPFMRGRQPMWLEYEAEARSIEIAGAAVFAFGLLMGGLALLRPAPRPKSFILATIALGIGVSSGQIVLAPLIAFLVWSCSFTQSNHAPGGAVPH